MNRTLFIVLAALAVTTGCAAGTEPTEESQEETAVAESDLTRWGGVAADGDACTVRTNPDGTTVPGTEKGLECCSTANPTDCVVILKPFPKSFYAW